MVWRGAVLCDMPIKYITLRKKPRRSKSVMCLKKIEELKASITNLLSYLNEDVQFNDRIHATDHAHANVCGVTAIEIDGLKSGSVASSQSQYTTVRINPLRVNNQFIFTVAAYIMVRTCASLIHSVSDFFPPLTQHSFLLFYFVLRECGFLLSSLFSSLVFSSSF